MEAAGGVDIEVLVERIEGVRRDVASLQSAVREDHHRLRNVESSVQQMIDAQKVARASEARQYRRVASAVQMGGLAMAAAMVMLTIVTILVHH